MPRPHVPDPQALVERLLRLLPRPPHPHPRPAGDRTATADRILDAALATFTEHGIAATTMSQIARDSGISREWLYKHHRNRDALVLAVARREAVRFIDGLAVRAFEHEDRTEALVDAFVFAVEFLRDHELLQRVLRDEPSAIAAQLASGAGPLVAGAVATAAAYLTAFGEMDDDAATRIAETLVRLVASTAIYPAGVLDLHDPETLRTYAATIVPAVLATAPAPTLR